jgi:hypothetical protein
MKKNFVSRLDVYFICFNNYVRFVILISVNIKIRGFSDVTPVCFGIWIPTFQ